MRYGSKVLFDDVTTTFSAGRRYGLTGPNGAGKSTFMKLLTGELPPQKGTVVAPAKLGVLRQDHFAFDRFRVVDTVVMGNGRLWSALEEREAALREDRDDRRGRHAARRARRHRRRRGRLHGGERRGDSAAGARHRRTSCTSARWGSCRAARRCACCWRRRCSDIPQALLLDEPTNHLDLESIHWVREFLVRYDGTLIVISHDRHFLNAVCTHTADIDYQTIITYTGGYDDMVLAKTQIRSRVESDNEQREKKIAQLNDFIARFHAGTRASQVTSRRKEVERLQTTELARSNIQRPYIKFTMNRPSGRVALECADVAKAHGGKPVVAGFGAIVNRGEKIVLVGRNGLGKTTLLKALLADAPGVDPAPARHRPRHCQAGVTKCRSGISRRITPGRSRRA